MACQSIQEKEWFQYAFHFVKGILKKKHLQYYHQSFHLQTTRGNPHWRSDNFRDIWIGVVSSTTCKAFIVSIAIASLCLTLALFIGFPAVWYYEFVPLLLLIISSGFAYLHLLWFLPFILNYLLCSSINLYMDSTPSATSSQIWTKYFERRFAKNPPRDC